MTTTLHDVIEKEREQLRPRTTSPLPQRFLEQLNNALKKEHINATAVLGGSWAKGTYLPGDHDIDIFVKFSPNYDDKELSPLLGKTLQTLGKAERIKGSRDYYQLRKQGFIFEIVPVINITTPREARNVTDVSPFHVDYVKKKIATQPSLADEIRLTKQFCKAAKVYGAESYINGFSGHVIDLLIIHYGSFINLLRAATTWQPQVIIDIEGKGNINKLNKAKRTGPLIIIDPIQPERNAAAALTHQPFNTFKERAQQFLTNPSQEYFTITLLTKEHVAQQHPHQPFICYELYPLKGSKDVAGTKLLKAHEHIVKQAQQQGFTIIDEGFEFNGEKATAYIVVENEPLPPLRKHVGPPLTEKEDCERFTQAHPDATEENGRLITMIPREHRTLKDLFTALAQSQYVRNRAKKAKVI